MSSRFAVVLKHTVATLTALLFALCFLSTFAAAQTNQPVDEVFGGYSWLHTNGYINYGFKSPDIVDGFDLSNTYYFPQMHNLGALLDLSYHWNGKNPVADDIDVGNLLAGIQYKYHTDTFSPFARIFVGGVGHWGGGGTHWSVGAGAGGL